MKHLHILTECKLFVQEQSERQIRYYMNAEKMKEVADFIKPFHELWDDRFNKLEAMTKDYK